MPQITGRSRHDVGVFRATANPVGVQSASDVGDGLSFRLGMLMLTDGMFYISTRTWRYRTHSATEVSSETSILKQVTRFGGTEYL